MNLVGKIFTVLIFVMSLVFMSFAVAVYATHKNWKDVVGWPREAAGAGKEVGLKYQLEDQKTLVEQGERQLANLDEALTAEIRALEQAQAKLRDEHMDLEQELSQREGEQATLMQSEREAVATMQTTLETADALRKEVDGLRNDIRQAEGDRDTHFKELVRLTDALHQAVNELKGLQDRNLGLTADMGKARELLRRNNLDPDKEYSEIPPPVRGIVLATPESDLIEISIGEDDGLSKGHPLEVYRVGGGPSKYLGRVVVMKTAPDKAVCRIDPNFRKGAIQKGDRVASNLE